MLDTHSAWMQLTNPQDKPVALASASLFFSFEPSLEFLQRVIQWLTDFCHLTLRDTEAVSRLELAVSELVENVVKYGIAPDVHVEVELTKRGPATVLRLITLNTAAPHELERALKLLDSIRDAEDPIAFYDQLILETAPKKGVSGLGLARIKAEGDLDLEYEVVGDNQLRICVEAVVCPA